MNRIALPSLLLAALIASLAPGCSPERSPLVDDTELTADETLFQEALALYDAADFAGAQAKFDTLVADFPESSRHDNAGYLGGRCRYELRLYAEAVTALEAMRALHPDSSFVSSAAYFTGRARFEQGLYIEAVVDFEDAALDQTATYADNASYFIGRSYYEEGQLPEAVAAFVAFEAAFPLSSYADNGAYYHGRALFDDGEFANARPQFDRILVLSGANGGSIYADNGQYYTARCSYALADLPLALQGFEAVQTNHVGSQYVDNAMYYEVRTFVDQANCTAAAAALVELQNAFPTSPEIARAQRYLTNGGC